MICTTKLLKQSPPDWAVLCYNKDMEQNEKLQQSKANEPTEWDEIAFERKTDHELTLPEKKELILFFGNHGGKKEWDAYEIFVTDVDEKENKKINHEELIAGIQSAPDLTHLFRNGFYPESIGKDFTDIDTKSTPIAFESGGFTHIRFFGDHDVENDQEIARQTYCRFYICPEIEKLPEILPKLVDKYKEKGLRLAAKFANTNERNDRMVIYSDKGSAISQLETLQELKDENPDLFQNLGRNRLWGEIEGIDGIYFGEENPYYKPGGFSYSEDRARVVGRSYEVLQYLKDSGREIDDEVIETIFDLSSLCRYVNPKCWAKCVEKENPLYSDAEEILYAIQDPKQIESLKDEVDIEKFIKAFPALKSLLEKKN